MSFRKADSAGRQLQVRYRTLGQFWDSAVVTLRDIK
jgi:hypothetical protein